MSYKSYGSTCGRVAFLYHRGLVFIVKTPLFLICTIRLQDCQDCHKKLTHKRVYILVINLIGILPLEQCIFYQLHCCQIFVSTFSLIK
jgi:hypothetical protein